MSIYVIFYVIFCVIFQISFNSQTPQTGFIKEWTLMLHGTRDPPYSGLPVTDPHSKLAIVKKAHEERNKL
jgi:proprotein convertase subtilisin/kexin type 2